MSTTEELLSLVASAGRLNLGPGAKFIKCTNEVEVTGGANYSSAITRAVAEFQSSNKSKTTKQSFFIKNNEPNKERRDTRLIDFQFQNEVYIYENVVPFLTEMTKLNIFPRYYYGSASPNDIPEKYVLVLEDLQSKDYKMSPQTIDLDFDHCALAFRQLGVFHALSFEKKKSNPEKFYKLVEDIVETRLIEKARDLYDCRHTTAVERAAGPLLEKKIHVDEVNNFLHKIQDSLNYLKEILAVNEPMVVICHGDFCRNNVLYKYEHGKPIDIKIFDLGSARYGSPMLDFSYFFQLNCSETLRAKHKEEFLRIYHESLSSAVPGLEVPSLDDFREEFRRKAIFGFLLSSSFKPFLMKPAHEAIVDPAPIKDFYSKEETRRRVLTNGGKAATQVTANLLKELIESKCYL